jgi:hypothetical protein
MQNPPNNRKEERERVEHAQVEEKDEREVE